MNKILITGGFGYLGARFSKELLGLGYEVSILTRSKPLNFIGWENKLEEIIIADITNPKTYKKLEARDYDIIIHLISSDINSSSDINFKMQSDVNSTINLLEIFKKNTKRFIYLSTVHVYGELNGKNDENSITSPLNIYGLTHLLSENICQI